MTMVTKFRNSTKGRFEIPCRRRKLWYFPEMFLYDTETQCEWHGTFKSGRRLSKTRKWGWHVAVVVDNDVQRPSVNVADLFKRWGQPRRKDISNSWWDRSKRADRVFPKQIAGDVWLRPALFDAESDTVMKSPHELSLPGLPAKKYQK